MMMLGLPFRDFLISPYKIVSLWWIHLSPESVSVAQDLDLLNKIMEKEPRKKAVQF